MKTKIGISLEQQVDKRRHLGLDLLLGAENMRVVLDEMTYAHQAMQGAGGFVAMTRTELRQAQRQVAVTFQTLIKNLHMARAIHGLDGVFTFFRLSREHHLA